MIIQHKIVQEGNEEVLYVYMSQNNEEFAKEFGSSEETEKGLLSQIKDYMNTKQVNFAGNIVKVVAGTFVVASMLFNPMVGENVQASSTEPQTVYTVQQGDNLSVIASQYGITVNDLMTTNQLTSDIIQPGQTLKINSGTTYTVQSGDNLSVIASRYGTTVTNLKQINNLTSDIIQPGQVLNIASAQTSNDSTYTVQSGDNLSVIASRYGTTVTNLKQLNNLTSDVIQPGQVLKISGTTQQVSTSISNSYTVKSGDSLSLIASKTGLTINQLKTYNRLTSDVIQPGQVLTLIPSAEIGTYTVQSGDSLYVIAKNYGMTVTELQSLNNIGDTIYPGQTLKVVQAQSPTTYTVQSGDSLWLIANQNNISVSQLKSFNNLTSDVLSPGQTLRIPVATTTTAQTTPIAQTESNIVIKVRRANGAVESIALEEYLVGVVASEVPPHFNEEAFKAQALAARTYAVSKAQSGVVMYDDARDQVYRDNNQLKAMWGNNFNTYYTKAQNAVNTTKGQVLKYNGELIVAYYHSTNNGKTENSKSVWGGDVPYLRSVSSSYDFQSPEYYKKTTMSYSEFRSRLGIPTTSSLSAQVTARTDGDSVYLITIAGRQFTGNQVKSNLGLRSTDFTLTFNNGVVTIEQRGWGHQVGLSQYGAHFMGQDGYTYDQILKHYYQGVSIENI